MDARVSFYNIKTDENMNSLSLDEQMSLWTPTIVFWNTEEQLKTVNDKNTQGVTIFFTSCQCELEI